MPHLSPISWIMTLSIFWALLISTLSFLWWHQHMSFNSSYSSSLFSFRAWKW